MAAVILLRKHPTLGQNRVRKKCRWTQYTHCPRNTMPFKLQVKYEIKDWTVSTYHAVWGYLYVTCRISKGQRLYTLPPLSALPCVKWVKCLPPTLEWVRLGRVLPSRNEEVTGRWESQPQPTVALRTQFALTSVFLSMTQESWLISLKDVIWSETPFWFQG